MTRTWVLIVAVAALGACAGARRPVTTPARPTLITDGLTAQAFERASCVRTPPASAPASDELAAPPVTWSGFEIVGAIADDAATVRALFGPTMSRHRALTDSAREDIARISGGYGYHVVAITTRETGTGTLAVIHLAPLPMVREVDVDIEVPLKESWFRPILDDEVRRRMRVRTGSYLPWAPNQRACELDDERQRLEEYLRDEGYIDGRVAIQPTLRGAGIKIEVEVVLGPEYTTGKIEIAERAPDGISDDEIRAMFRHSGFCIISKACFGSARFKRSQYQEDIQRVVELFHRRGFPAVRVRTDYDPLTSFDRLTKTVEFMVTIDQRRQLDVVFEGHDPDAIPIDELRSQLTFNQAASADDVEAHDSARAITAYLQGRGFFDARVTWSRERFDRFDRIIFRIEQGTVRQVRAIEFAGNYAFDADTLRDSIAIREAKFSSSLFGKRTAATSEQLAGDVDRLVDLYRRAGYREARVKVSAATSELGLDSAALAAGLLVAGRGDGLYVRYTITEGQPTLLTQVVVELTEDGSPLTTPDQLRLCRRMLAGLASDLGEPQIATSAVEGRCIGIAANLKFREPDALETRDRLKDRLYSLGRPRAEVAYEPRMVGRHRVAAHYRLSHLQPLRIGKVVLRGNFRTSEGIILEQLGLDEGQPLTSDVLAEGARRLRNTGLFDAVNVALPDLDNISEGQVNAVVEVVERYDYRAQLDTEAGYSSFNGAFLRVIPSLKNLFGIGISLDLAGTIGLDLAEYLSDGNLSLRQLGAESTLRIPPWLSPIGFQHELIAFHRRQDTPRFGVLTTDGVTLSQQRRWSWSRSKTRPDRGFTFGFYYDFRLRERLVDVLRPAGADDDQTQVPISTRTGSVGLITEWEERVDRQGALSPLSPQDGFRLEGRVSFASPYLAGQDTFIKVSAAGSKFWSVGDNLVLRADLRYDQGIPLGGAVLLPEVERFFAGGDSTVRGYEDDRLATEIIQVGVPPIDNVTQLRILPAGGNIRVMGSLDAQLRIYKVFATAAFIDAGMITNQWTTVTEDDIRPAVGIALFRIVTPFGTGALERAMPLRPQLGDNPRGRWHLSFAARAQF